ncbi:MAG: mismatch-specific DNA-glycosylase [Mycobacteriales bacterium]
MGFTRAELAAFRGATVPDLVGSTVRLLFVGINPGLWTAATQAHFARRGNRFYPALFRAGIVDRLIDASGGYRPEDLAHLKARGVGITNLVAMASARADELTAAELIAGAASLTDRVRRVGPAAVAMLGITSYSAAFGRPKAVAGPQPERIGGAPLWVLPNPSGLNAHASLASLGAAYRQAAIAAGIDVFAEPD